MRSRIPGFYRLPLAERRGLLVQRFGLTAEELQALEGGLSAMGADHMVENAIGVLGLPLGLGLNFVINGEPVLVPMAIEEPSVVAACSHVARLALPTGGFAAEADPPRMIAQVQVVGVPDVEHALTALEAARDDLKAEADGYCEGLTARGGGCV